MIPRTVLKSVLHSSEIAQAFYKLQIDDMKLERVVDPKHSVANIRIFEYIRIFFATTSTWLCGAIGFERIARG